MEQSTQRTLHIIKTTLIGGLFFLVPLIVLGVLAGKVLSILKPISSAIALSIPFSSALGAGKVYIITIILVLFICYLAGIFAKTKPAKQFINWIEEHVLSNIPGYMFMKKTNENIYGINKNKEYDVILVKDDEAWQIGFLIEHIDEYNSIVYIPGAPSPWSGELKFVNKDNIKDVDLSYKDAMNCINKLGQGSGVYFKGKI